MLRQNLTFTKAPGNTNDSNFTGALVNVKFKNKDCKGFLLSDRAVMNAKPQMKIFNDDVICKHGATIGSLNEDEIFYLRTRGLDRKKAINLILDGHINSYIGHEAFLKEFLPEEYR